MCARSCEGPFEGVSARARAPARASERPSAHSSFRALLSLNLLSLPLSTQAPLAALASFGAYALTLLIVGILSFRDCPEDAVALQKVREGRDGEREGQAALSPVLSSSFLSLSLPLTTNRRSRPPGPTSSPGASWTHPVRERERERERLCGGIES